MVKDVEQRENAVPCINEDCPFWDDKFTMDCSKQVSGEVYATICEDYEPEDVDEPNICAE